MRNVRGSGEMGACSEYFIWGIPWYPIMEVYGLGVPNNRESNGKEHGK